MHLKRIGYLDWFSCTNPRYAPCFQDTNKDILLDSPEFHHWLVNQTHPQGVSSVPTYFLFLSLSLSLSLPLSYAHICIHTSALLIAHTQVYTSTPAHIHIEQRQHRSPVIYECVMLHIWPACTLVHFYTCAHTYRTEPAPVTCETRMSHGTHVNESSHTCGCVMSHMCTRHITYMSRLSICTYRIEPPLDASDIYLHTHTHSLMHTHTCTHTHTHIYLHTSTVLYPHTNFYIFALAYVHIHVHTHVYIHSMTHTSIQI